MIWSCLSIWSNFLGTLDSDVFIVWSLCCQTPQARHCLIVFYIKINEKRLKEVELYNHMHANESRVLLFYTFSRKKPSECKMRSLTVFTRNKLFVNEFERKAKSKIPMKHVDYDTLSSINGSVFFWEIPVKDL